MKQKVRFSILFAILFTLFLGSFFHLIMVSWILVSFGLYAGMMFWSVTNGPVNLRARQKKRIIATIISLTVILGIAQNIFMGLSFLILMSGIIYTFWNLNYYKNKVVTFSTWGYCVFGGFSMIYFMGFSVAANIVGANTALDLNCDSIYKYYTNISKIFSNNRPEPLMTKADLSRGERIENGLREALRDSPGLTQLYRKIKGYQQDISISITDQKQINREICDLVTERIHEIYTSSNVKIGLVLLLGLFLYPFFVLLMYAYGVIIYTLFMLAIHYGLFTKKTKTVERISLEWNS